jgi:hypothetical protein
VCVCVCGKGSGVGYADLLVLCKNKCESEAMRSSSSTCTHMSIKELNAWTVVERRGNLERCHCSDKIGGILSPISFY